MSPLCLATSEALHLAYPSCTIQAITIPEKVHYRTAGINHPLHYLLDLGEDEFTGDFTCTAVSISRFLKTSSLTKTTPTILKARA